MCLLYVSGTFMKNKKLFEEWKRILEKYIHMLGGKTVNVMLSCNAFGSAVIQLIRNDIYIYAQNFPVCIPSRWSRNKK